MPGFLNSKGGNIFENCVFSNCPFIGLTEESSSKMFQKLPTNRDVISKIVGKLGLLC